jgi:predicted NBD/HSP70 family sugar kinase
MDLKMTNKSLNSMKFRHYNERIVLGLIRQLGEASKGEVSRKAGLTPAGAGLVIDALEANGFIKQVGKRFGQRGSPSVLFALNADRIFSIGFKIGRRTFETVLVDFSATERARQDYDYSWPEPEFISRVGRAGLTEFVRKSALYPGSEISGIGLGIPFFLGGWNGELGFPVDLGKLWSKVDPGTLFTSGFDYPVFVANDASAAALGELTFGPGARLRDFMHISIDTLVGGGLVQNGKLLTGPHGNGAALGPLPVSPSAISPVPEGGTRLLHRASAVTLIDHLARNGIAIDRMRDVEAHIDSPAAAAWLKDCSEALVEAIIAIASVVDIRAVVLDSVLPERLGQRLLNLVQTQFGRAPSDGIVPPTIVAGSFGARAASIGAAALPLAALLDITNATPLTLGQADGKAVFTPPDE